MCFCSRTVYEAELKRGQRLGALWSGALTGVPVLTYWWTKPCINGCSMGCLNSPGRGFPVAPRKGGHPGNNSFELHGS